MRASVLAWFPAFTKAREGAVRVLYADSKDKVTIGWGDLEDSIAAAQALPLVHRSDGTPASKGEIAAEWTRVKAGRLSAAAANASATLMLTDAGIQDLVTSTLARFERELRQFLETWDDPDTPAEAQAGAISMAWALGGDFPPGWPKWTAAFNRKDWATCADESDIPEGENGVNPNLHPRNVADAVLFRNAAAVAARGLDPSVVYYPRDLTAEGTGAPLPTPIFAANGPPPSGARGGTVAALVIGGVAAAVAWWMLRKG